MTEMSQQKKPAACAADEAQRLTQ